jgi:hypothetical protein
MIAAIPKPNKNNVAGSGTAAAVTLKMRFVLVPVKKFVAGGYAAGVNVS